MLSVKKISKSFNQIDILNDINIEIQKGEFFSIVGPSGCGKTTLLRIISGLEIQDSGEIIIDNKNVDNLPPQKRNTGIVFQNYALFPNMTVFENVAYGLEVKKLSKDIIKEKVFSVLSKVQMQNKADKNVTTLSGGEQQRVSLARVMVTEPALLLFDEPLSNLDFSLRLETRNEIKRLQREIGITSVYVTHDQSEALALSDRICVLNKGVVQQTGTPYEVYYSPQNIFTAGFIGHSNFFDHKSAKEIFGIELNKDELLSVFPEELIPIKCSENCKAEIVDVQFTGYITEYLINVDGKIVKCQLQSGVQQDKFNTGENINLKTVQNKLRILRK